MEGGAGEASYYGGAPTCPGGGESGVGGVAIEYYGTQGSGGTQMAGGVGGVNSSEMGEGAAGSFGNGGASGYDSSTGGGGGGWYGGGGGGAYTEGGGGSGYVYTSTTTANYPSGCQLNSSYYLAHAQTIAGDSEFPSPAGGTETGHEGDGYARITPLDSTPPTGGSITYIATNLTHYNQILSLTVNDGSDPDTGIDTTSRILQRRYVGMDSNGNCLSTYTDYYSVSYSGTYPNITTSSFDQAKCYQYRWTVANGDGNRAFYSSATVVTTIPNTFSLSTLSLGTAITINETTFIKVNTDNLFLSLASICSQPTITASSSSVCSGQETVSLSVTASGIHGNTCTWSSSADPTLSHLVFDENNDPAHCFPTTTTLDQTTDYTVTMSSCQQTATATITANPIPATPTVTNTPACGSATITASGGDGGILYYQGTNPSGISTSDAATSKFFSATSTTQYYWRSLDANGCWSAAASDSPTINLNMGNMQTWNSCASYTTPSSINATNIGCLTDTRDGKMYEVRKFADGKCWMVDNLKYGGTGTDGCANKTTFDGCGAVSLAWGCDGTGASKYGYWSDGTNTSSNQLYGDCRNNPNDASYGYLYNWQAAMQHASAYYGVSYAGPTQNVQGLCPQGWHLPTGGTSGELMALHEAIGKNRTFWDGHGGSFKGVYSGYCEPSGNLTFQGAESDYWSSSQSGATYAYNVWIRIGNEVVLADDSSNKSYGFSVRCVKN